MRAALVLVALAALSPAVFGQQWDTNGAPTLSQSMPQRVLAQFRADEARRTGIVLERQILGIPGDTASRRVLDRMKGPGPITDVEFKVVRTVAAPAVAKALARALPLVGTVLAFKDIFDLVRCREAFGGGPECDDGAPETMQQTFRAVWGQTEGFGASGMAAVDSALALDNAKPYNTNTNGQGTTVYTHSRGVPFNGGGGMVWFEVDRRTVFTSATGYPASYDFTQLGVGGIGASATNALRCPTIATSGGTVSVVKGPDGLCPTLVYTPAPFLEVEDKVRTHVPPATVIARLPDLLARDIPVEHSAPGYQIDAPPQASRDTTTRPDGSVQTRDTSYPWENFPDGYGWRPRVETREWQPGATIPPIGLPAPPGIVVEGPGAVPQEIITCGLPGTPACKIDEGGTPPPVAPDALDLPSDALDPLRALIENPPVANVGFTWSFQLPSACSVIPVTGFHQYVVEIDICRFQPMIHDLMSIIWCITGIFAGWQIITRTLG